MSLVNKNWVDALIESVNEQIDGTVTVEFGKYPTGTIAKWIADYAEDSNGYRVGNSFTFPSKKAADIFLIDVNDLIKYLGETIKKLKTAHISK